MGQISKLEILFTKSLASDHAMLTLHIYSYNSIVMASPPAPNRYKVDDNKKAEWKREF